jgi:hypothetical protein
MPVSVNDRVMYDRAQTAAGSYAKLRLRLDATIGHAKNAGPIE